MQLSLNNLINEIRKNRGNEGKPKIKEERWPKQYQLRKDKIGELVKKR